MLQNIFFAKKDVDGMLSKDFVPFSKKKKKMRGVTEKKLGKNNLPLP
jgi:hypothetical protein